MTYLHYKKYRRMGEREEMINFWPNPLSDEDPMGKMAELVALSVWYRALPLIITNLCYIPLGVYAYRIDAGILGISDFTAMIISIFFHVCQTEGECFGLDLPKWTIADHVSAPSFLHVLSVFLVFYLVNDIFVYRLRDDANHYALGLQEQEQEKEKHYQRERVIYDNWGSSFTYIGIFVAFIATLAHPFSMQAFLIVIAFDMGMIFFKIVILDDGRVPSVDQRVSIPELVTGVVLTLIALIGFVLDSYIFYAGFHSIWHSVGGIGYFFIIVGITKDHPKFIPVCKIIKNWFSF